MSGLRIAPATALLVVALVGGGMATSWAVSYSQASTAIQVASDALTDHRSFETVADELRKTLPTARLVRCGDGRIDEIHLIAPTPWPHLSGVDFRFKAVAIRTNRAESKDLPR